MNDIAAGLAHAVSHAVSESLIHHKNSTTNSPAQQMLRGEGGQQFSQLRQQLESKTPVQPPQQTILRKRLSNLNIEAAVTHAVNDYLNTTIKTQDKFNQNQQENVAIRNSI
jgi:hypothetical protein